MSDQEPYTFEGTLFQTRLVFIFDLYSESSAINSINPNSKMKLICAGQPKTGTKSIAQALRVLGYSVCGFDEQVLNYTDEWLDLYKHGKVPDFYAMFKDVDVVIGVLSMLFFEEIMEAFPDAKVLLSEREEGAWMRSLNNHFKESDTFYPTMLKIFVPTLKQLSFVILNSKMAAIGTSDTNSSYICRKRYRWHNDRVKSVVPPDKLLVYSVQQGWEPLCEFTGDKIPDQPFPLANVKGELIRTLLIETELGRKIAREVKMVKVCFAGVLVALIGVVLMNFLF